MRRFIFSILFLSTGLFFPTLTAQDAEARTVEEVVVTALRKETSLQDTAITITAITGDSLETQQIENFEDLQFAIPTLGFQKGAYSGSGISLRGIGNFAVGNSSSAAIGYFWNGNGGSISSLYEAELFDIERVEVLRGPQGTLYGAGTTGGVVQVVTKKPGANFGGYVKADVADYDSTRISAAINLPLSDTVRSRFAASSLQRGGFVTNSFNGKDLDDRNTQSARATVEWDVSEETTVTFAYEAVQADDNRMRAARQFCKQDAFYGCSPFETGMDAVFSAGSYGHWVPYLQFQNTGLNYTVYRNNPSSDVRSVDLDFTPEHTAEYQSSLIQIDHQFDNGVSMMASTSYFTRNYRDLADYDHSVSVVPYAMGPVVTALGPDSLIDDRGVGVRAYVSDQAVDRSMNESEWSHHQLIFTSDFDGAFNFNIGLIRSDTDSETNYHIMAPYMQYWADTSKGPICAFFSYACGYGGAPFWASFFQGVAGANATVPSLIAAGIITPAQAQGYVLNAGAQAGVAAASNFPNNGVLPDWQSYYHNDSNLNRSTSAMFGEFYFDLSDKTTLTLGGRYTEYEISDWAYSALLDLQGNAAGNYSGIQPAPINRVFDSDESTYKIGLEHNLDDDHLVWVTYATGFKPGGSNPTDGTGGVPTTFGPEIANTLEIGIKSTFLDGALQINTSAYSNEYDGLQLSKIIRRSSVNENADSTIEGIETEFKFFASNTLMIDGFVAWTDATIDRFESVDPLNPNNATVALPNQDLFTPIGGTATGFLADFKQYNALCAAGLATGGPCILGGIASMSALLGALVKYQNTDAGLVYKSFGPLCTQPFYGLDSTTLPCPATDGVKINAAGNKLPLSAELNWRLGVSKFFERPGGTWVLRVDYSYRDETWSDALNTARNYVPEVELIDLSLRFTSSDESWYAGIYARNATDEDHLYAKYSTDPTVAGFANGVAVDPKIMGINFGINF